MKCVHCLHNKNNTGLGEVEGEGSENGVLITNEEGFDDEEARKESKCYEN
jgi:hypothetical protein